MLRISKLTDYAIVLLVQMSQENKRTFAAADLAESTGIALPTVSKILKTLTRAGVVISTRGAHGGYALAQGPEQTSVARVIDALEGPISLTECGTQQNLCRQAPSCEIRGNWSVINLAIRAALESVSLADMVRPAAIMPTEVRIPISQIQHHPR